MKIKKITLISDNICYGSKPKPETEIQQKLTILKNGRVWFNGYNYGKGYGNFEIGRKIQLSIGKKQAMLIFKEIDKLLCQNDTGMFITDVGSWNMSIIDEDDKVYKFNGCLLGGTIEGDIAVTKFIRKSIPIEKLFVFTGFHRED